MRVIASESARRYVSEHGGRIYVWPQAARCCRGTEFLRSGTEPRRGHEFRRVADDGLEVYFPADLRELPEELHLELRRFARRRVEAYWNGLAWWARD